MTAPSLRPMANVDGEITPLHEAGISILDRGFLYGDSVYEVFRTYAGVPLFCHEHFDRLEESARLIQMTIAQSRDELLAEIRRTAQAAGVSPAADVYVRWHITRGAGPIDLVPPRDVTSTFVILVKAVPVWNPDFYTAGVRLAVTRVRRNPVEALSPHIKSGNYLNNILGVTEAVELDADDCLMLNPAGMVTEASNSNVLFVIDDLLVTPSPASGVLRGITKSALANVSREQGLAVHEREIPVDELSRATECFVTSATREVMPVAGLRLEDGVWREFPPGGGDVTRQVAHAYRGLIDRYVAEHPGLRLC